MAAGTTKTIGDYLGEQHRSRPRRFVAGVLTFSRKKPLAAFGGFVVTLLIVLALFGPLIVPKRYDAINIRERFKGPAPAHWFGTDDKGRDVYSRVLYGARITVVVGFGATLVATLLATSIGTVSGYFGGL